MRIKWRINPYGKGIRMSIIGMVVIALIHVSLPSFAQPGDPGAQPPEPVPISGLEWLLLAGGALGASRIVKKFREGRHRE